LLRSKSKLKEILESTRAGRAGRAARAVRRIRCDTAVSSPTQDKVNTIVLIGLFVNGSVFVTG
jgi:hypothetical protein